MEGAGKFDVYHLRFRDWLPGPGGTTLKTNGIAEFRTSDAQIHIIYSETVLAELVSLSVCLQRKVRSRAK